MSMKTHLSSSALASLLAGTALALGGPVAVAQSAAPAQDAPAAAPSDSDTAPTPDAAPEDTAPEADAPADDATAAPDADTDADTASSGEVFLTEQESSQTLASSLIGMSVKNGMGDDAEEIGKIKDLILDEDQQLAGVIVGVGGFLGLGQKDVAIAWDQVDQVDADAGEAEVGMTREELEEAPTFKSTEAQEKEQQQQQQAPAAPMGGGGGGAGGGAF